LASPGVLPHSMLRIFIVVHRMTSTSPLNALEFDGSKE
jgi:hypothetical protein